MEEKIKFLSETHDKMMGMLLELDKKSIPYFINDLKNLKDEYNVEFPSQLENTIVNTSEQNTNNGNQPPKNKKV